MEFEAFARKFPRLYHATDTENVPFIMQEGLHCAEEIVRRAGLSEIETQSLLSSPRKKSIPIEFPNGAKALLRDQKPLRLAHLQRRYPHLPANVYTRSLSRRIFFWCSDNKKTSTGSSIYNGRHQTILIFDTAKVLLDFGDQIELCRVNSGTILMPSAVGSEENRNPATMFQPFRSCSWRLSAIKEVTMLGSIGSVQQYLIDS
jgi:hypothetical protein